MDSTLDYWEERYKNTGNITAASEIFEPTLVNKRAKQKFAKIVLSAFDELAFDLKTAHVLSAGSGSGIVSEVLASHCKTLHGFDFSERAIREVIDTDPSGTYIIASASVIPFQRQFEVVTAFSLLYHIINDDEWQSAIEQLANATKQGGYLLLRINWSEEALGNQSSDSHFYDRSRHEYMEEFARNSLALIDVVELPVKPRLLNTVSSMPGGKFIKSVIAPIIAAGDLFKEHNNKLVILRKDG